MYGGTVLVSTLEVTFFFNLTKAKAVVLVDDGLASNLDFGEKNYWGSVGLWKGRPFFLPLSVFACPLGSPGGFSAAA